MEIKLSVMDTTKDIEKQHGHPHVWVELKGDNKMIKKIAKAVEDLGYEVD